MKPTIALFCLAFCAALLACPAQAAPRWLDRRDPPPEDPLATCSERAEAISAAPNPIEAKSAVSSWLGCVEAQRAPQPDLRERLDTRLNSNRFEPVRRQKAAIMDHYVDRNAMKEIPGSPPALQAWLDRAADQELYARASGDTPYADALSARASRLKKLQTLLEYLDS